MLGLVSLYRVAQIDDNLRIDIVMSMIHIPCILFPEGRSHDAQKNHDLPRAGDARTSALHGARREGIDGRAHPARGDRLFEGSPEKAGSQMRGDGCIYPRGNMLWIAYSFRGKMFRESAHTTDEKVARKVLRQRLKQVERPGF